MGGRGEGSFMEKATKRLDHIIENASIVVLATHANDVIQKICNKALLLEHGKIKFFGPVDEALAIYTQQTAIT